jgi:hypothetical protein
MPKKRIEVPAIEVREFRSAEEIDAAIGKLRRRISEAQSLDVPSAIRARTGAESVVESNIRESIRDVFGTNSPEFQEHSNLCMWAGGMYMNMALGDVILGTERGRTLVIGVLNGLIGRLEEKRDDTGTSESPPVAYFDKLNLHPRIVDVSRELFLDGHCWEAVVCGREGPDQFREGSFWPTRSRRRAAHEGCIF